MRNPAEIGVLLAIAAIASGALTWIFWSTRKNPEERERLRRLVVNRQGRIGDAFIGDVVGDILYYSYSFRGVEYSATQDISSIRHLLPDNLEGLVGPVTVKYIPANPCNSIIVCEEWSGVRLKDPRMLLKGA